MKDGGDIWVFAYGSLMWRPEFDFIESRPALLRGYHRALCLYSIRYRGVPERPGVVLGLDHGGSCRGRALRVTADRADAVLNYLTERELINGVYRQAWLPVMAGADTVSACAFVADRRHVQYTGNLDIEATARLVAQGIGPAGTALDYLRNTIEHLNELGIREGRMHAVLRRAEEIAAS